MLKKAIMVALPRPAQAKANAVEPVLSEPIPFLADANLQDPFKIADRDANVEVFDEEADEVASEPDDLEDDGTNEETYKKEVGFLCYRL